MNLPILNLKQNTPEWHQWRAQGLGASDIPALYGKHPTMSEYKLWLLKTGQVEYKEIHAESLSHGHIEEKKCLEYLKKAWLDNKKLLEKDQQHEVYSACIQHVKYPHLRASIDAYFPFLDIIMQIKCPFGLDNKCITIYEHIPDYWIYQMQAEEAVVRSYSIGIQNHLCLWLGESEEPRVFALESDLALQEEMIKKADHWWMHHVVMGNPVKPDSISLDQEGIKNKLFQYEEYQSTIKEIELKKKALKCEIETYLDGTSNYHTDSHQIIRMSSRTSYDFNEMKRDGINLSKYIKSSNGSTYVIKKKNK